MYHLTARALSLPFNLGCLALTGLAVLSGVPP